MQKFTNEFIAGLAARVSRMANIDFTKEEDQADTVYLLRDYAKLAEAATNTNARNMELRKHIKHLQAKLHDAKNENKTLMLKAGEQCKTPTKV